MPTAALITGANGGIGQALCHAFQQAGHLAIGTDVHAQSKSTLPYVCADLGRVTRDSAARSSFRDAVLAIVGENPLKVLVNNAAVQVLAGFEQLSEEDFRESLEINLVAPLMLSKLFLPELESSGGSIVNMGSIHARATKPGFASYATSKAALLGLTRAMAVDLGNRVRVNVIQPAAVDTDMLRAGFAGNSQGLSELARCHPVGRIAQPHEVARMAVFLASDEAGFLTGSAFDIDGGIGSRLHDPQ